VERVKNATLRLAFATAMEDAVFALARVLPGRKALKTSSHAIASGSLARASEIGGTKPFGGVVIDRERARREGLDYEGLRDRVIGLLEDARGTEGERVVEWVARREERVSGPAAQELYPDVLFGLAHNYGVGFALYDGISGPNTMHRRVSGGHRPKAYFGYSGPAVGSMPSRLEDVYSFIVEASARCGEATREA
jgi:hypothetical protein